MIHKLTVSVSPDVREHETLGPAADTATGWLKSVIKRTPGEIVAEWDLATDGAGRDLLTLRFREDGYTESAVFDPREFEDRLRTESRFLRVFGKLLQKRSRAMLDELLAAPAEEGA